MDRPKIDRIRVLMEIDECPDYSYLKTELSEDGKTMLSTMRYSQQELDKHPIITKRYIKEDMDRYKKFESGELFCYGIVAEAEVSYPLNDHGDRRTEKFTSGGLWGLESDSNKSYFKEVAGEQLEDLREHLDKFNIQPIRRMWVNGDYWEDVKKESIDLMTSYKEDKHKWVKVED